MIILRGDGNMETGYGHVFRLLAIHSLLRDQKALLITRCDNLKLIEKNKAQGLEVISIPESVSFDDECNWIQDNDWFKPSSTTAFLDGYHFTTEYEKALKTQGCFVVTISDEPIREYASNAVINHGIQGIPHSYPHSNHLTYYFGFKYLLLRSDFFKKRQNTSSKKQVFVAFGGADPLGLTKTYVEWLDNLLPAEYQIVALSKGNSSGGRITFTYGLGTIDMIHLMDESEFGVIASSTTALEACARNLPIITGHFIDNQKNIYQSIVHNRCGVGLGEFQSCSFQQFSDELQEVMIRKKEISTQQANLFIDSSRALKTIITK
jgi:spore coat polysaccharide biosynthesis predicted glycosyltransferase SpsG